MRILFVCSTLKRSGPVNQVYNLILGLDRSAMDVQLLTLSPEPVDSRASDFRKLGVSLHSLGLPRWQGALIGIQRFRSFLAKVRPDIVHSHGFRADVFASLSDGEGAFVSTIHNFPQIDYVSRYGWPIGMVMAKLHLAYLRSFDAVVGVSEAVTSNLRSTSGVGRPVAIPNGVQLDQFRAGDVLHRDRVRASLGFKPNTTIWLSVGHLSDLKDPMTIVDAWRGSVGRDKRHALLFLGDGDLRQRVERSMQDDANVRVLGRVLDVASYMAASDVFVSASQTEGLPNAAIEALASGLPVVLTDIPAHRELVGHHTDVGWLFPVGDSGALAELISNVDVKELPYRSALATELAETNYSAASMSDKYQSLYCELCAPSG